MQLAGYLFTLTWIASFKQTPNWVQVKVTRLFRVSACLHKCLNFLLTSARLGLIIEQFLIMVHFFHKLELIWFNELIVGTTSGLKQDQSCLTLLSPPEATHSSLWAGHGHTHTHTHRSPVKGSQLVLCWTVSVFRWVRYENCSSWLLYIYSPESKSETRSLVHTTGHYSWVIKVSLVKWTQIMTSTQPIVFHPACKTSRFYLSILSLQGTSLGHSADILENL